MKNINGEIPNLCRNDAINAGCAWLRNHPEIDVLESHGEFPDGEKATVVIMRGHHDIARPIRKLKKELKEKDAEIKMLNKTLYDSCEETRAAWNMINQLFARINGHEFLEAEKWKNTHT